MLKSVIRSSTARCDARHHDLHRLLLFEPLLREVQIEPEGAVPSSPSYPSEPVRPWVERSTRWVGKTRCCGSGTDPLRDSESCSTTARNAHVILRSSDGGEVEKRLTNNGEIVEADQSHIVGDGDPQFVSDVDSSHGHVVVGAEHCLRCGPFCHQVPHSGVARLILTNAPAPEVASGSATSASAKVWREALADAPGPSRSAPGRGWRRYDAGRREGTRAATCPAPPTLSATQLLSAAAQGRVRLSMTYGCPGEPARRGGLNRSGSWSRITPSMD